MGVDARGFPGGTPEARSRLCVCRASFLMTFVTGGVPHSGPQHRGYFFKIENQCLIDCAKLICIKLVVVIMCEKYRIRNSKDPIWVVKVQVKLFSRVQLFVTPWTVAHQAPPSMGFSRQEYWSGLPFPSAGDLPNPGIKPRSPALQADFLTSEPPGKLWVSIISL